MSKSTHADYPDGIAAVSAHFDVVDAKVETRYRATYSDGRSEEITKERYHELAQYSQA